jgi:DNA-binding protein
MAMHLRDYIALLDNYRKKRLMKNLFLILSDNPRKPKNEHLIAILAEVCNIIDPVMVKTKGGRARPDPNDILQHLFIPIKSVKAAKIIIRKLTYEGGQFWIPDKKLCKFVETWELLRQVLANNIAAGKKQSEEYYADVIKMFLVDQMCDGSNCHTQSGTD